MTENEQYAFYAGLVNGMAILEFVGMDRALGILEKIGENEHAANWHEDFAEDLKEIVDELIQI
jgi:hypothetical protein